MIGYSREVLGLQAVDKWRVGTGSCLWIRRPLELSIIFHQLLQNQKRRVSSNAAAVQRQDRLSCPQTLIGCCNRRSGYRRVGLIWMLVWKYLFFRDVGRPSDRPVRPWSLYDSYLLAELDNFMRTCWAAVLLCMSSSHRLRSGRVFGFWEYPRAKSLTKIEIAMAREPSLRPLFDSIAELTRESLYQVTRHEQPIGEQPGSRSPTNLIPPLRVYFWLLFQLRRPSAPMIKFRPRILDGWSLGGMCRNRAQQHVAPRRHNVGSSGSIDQ